MRGEHEMDSRVVGIHTLETFSGRKQRLSRFQYNNVGFYFHLSDENVC